MHFRLNDNGFSTEGKILIVSLYFGDDHGLLYLEGRDIEWEVTDNLLTFHHFWGETLKLAERCIKNCLNSFRSVSDLLILLWLTPDDFTRQEEKTSRTGKGLIII